MDAAAQLVDAAGPHELVPFSANECPFRRVQGLCATAKASQVKLGTCEIKLGTVVMPLVCSPF